MEISKIKNKLLVVKILQQMSKKNQVFFKLLKYSNEVIKNKKFLFKTKK